jgi:hypothetical protein
MPLFSAVVGCPKVNFTFTYTHVQFFETNVDCENHNKYINTLYEERAEFLNVEAGFA